MEKVSGKTKLAKSMVKLYKYLENGGQLEHRLRNCQKIAEEIGDEYGDYVVFENPRPIASCNGWLIKRFKLRWDLSDDGDSISEVYMDLDSPSGKDVGLCYALNDLNNEIFYMDARGPEAEIKFLLSVE